MFPEIIETPAASPVESRDHESLGDREDLIAQLPLVEKQPTPDSPEVVPVERKAPQTTPDKPAVEAPKVEALKPADDPSNLIEFEIGERKDTTTPEAFKSAAADALRAEPAPKGFHAKAWESWKTKVAGEIETRERELYETRNSSAREKLEFAKQLEALNKRISDLSGYETAIEKQASPEFERDYVAPIKRAEEGLIKFMQANGATKEGLEELQAKLSAGDEDYLLAAADAIAEKNPTLARKFKFEVERIMSAKQRRDIALDDLRQNHEKFVGERRAQQTQKLVQFDEGLKSSIGAFSTQLNEAKQPMYPFLVKMRAPANGSPEHIAAVETHNKFVEENIKALDSAARNDDPRERVRMAVGYMTAVVQGRIIQELQKQLKEAQGLVQRVKDKSAPPNSSGLAASNPASAYEGTLADLVDSQLRR